jgi:hypothetical protein
MLIAALVLLAAVGAAGVLLLALHFTRTRVPARVAPAHGMAGITGAVLLLAHVLRGGADGTTKAALTLFTVAALFGGILFSQQLRKRPRSMEVMGVHAALAAAGILALLVAVAGPVR